MIWISSAELYLGDVILVSALVGGLIATIGLSVKHSRKFIILDIDTNHLKRFMYFQIGWLLAALVLFKFIVLQGGPGFTKSVLTGKHGSVQFSTAGEIAAAVVILVGLYRWGRWLYRRARLINA
ncbi:MAG: hypothetical protein JWM55_222 [Acidimicrobiaceae bacterium]|nr:hypothetical protein [Acidimicrobiaceae bacterium]